MTTDKYGRTTSLEEKSDWASNAKSAVFTRQTLSESAGAAEVTWMYDPFENRTYTYAYDDANNCTGYEVFDGNGTSCKKRFGVRKTSENRTAYYLRRDGSYWESYCEAIYDDKLLNPRIKELVFNVGNGGNRAYFTYDELGRIKSKDFAVDGSEIAEYEYLSGTTLKSGITIKQNDGKEYNYTYEYDNRGNLKKSHIADWGNGSKKTKSYSYDKAGRLISESDGQSNFQYTYNADGTLASDGQKTYVYDKGRLKRTNSNAGTKYFMHDNLGNCTHFGRETEASEANLIWERGSKLKSMILPEGETAHYFYNSRGVRYKKTVGGTTTAFDYDTDKLVALERQSASKKESITFIYDSEGIAGFYHDGGLVGLFVKDASGNVISIVNNLFGEMARYEYDAWGKCTIVKDTQFLFGKIGEINPIRWKSQYFDAESGFYYIDGRYYSPEIRQYLSPENPESELMNAFTIYDINPYFLCLTNPISVEYNENTAFPSIQLVYDPPKLTKWQAFWRSGKNYLKGSAFLATSIYAIVSALSILSCGVLTPLMTVVGIATFAAGIATGINAAAEFQEGLTNFNFVRDIWFAGNKKVYNWYSLGIEAITSIGMLWIGGWLNYNAPRIQAYKNISNYKYSKSAGKHIGERAYYNSILHQKQIIKYGKMVKERSGVITFYIRGEAIYHVQNLYKIQKGIWELSILNQKALIVHYLLR